MKTELKYAILTLATVCQLYSDHSVAAPIPSGFEDSFKLKETSVRFRNLDGSFSDPMLVLSSYNTLKVNPNNKKLIAQIKLYLNDNNIDQSYHQEFINRLVAGVDDQSLCSGKLDTCVLYPETFDIVQNYNDHQVYVFVSPSVLEYTNNSQDKRYHAAQSKENGLINAFDLYLSAYDNRDSVISLNDKAVLGLPYGYFKTDVNLTNGESDSELYEAAYHLDVGASTWKVGHFEYDPEINSTDYLNNTSRMSQNSITFASSENLLVGGKNSDKVLSFYVPGSGSVKVLRDDRIIYQANVAEGQQSISYNDLPSGRYEATVEVSSGGLVVNSQVFQVYNSTNDTLASGSFDYTLSGGFFAESYYDYEDTDVKDIDNDAYVKGLLNYQATPGLQLGGGVLATEEGAMFTVGGTYNLLNTGLMLEGVHNRFDNASHSNFNLALPWFRVSYEELDNDKGDSVATHMYGFSDYSRWSVNSSYSLSGGRSLYAIYTRSDERVLVNKWGGYGNYDLNSNLVSIGYSTPAILKSRLSINVDYSDADDDTSINLLWSVPLSDSVEAITSVTTDPDRLSQLRTSLRKNDLIESDDVRTSMEVANTYNRDMNDMYQEATLSANGSNAYARGNALVYTSTQDSTIGINAGLSSTQIVTSDGVRLTKDKAEAFAVIDVEDIRASEESDNQGEEKGYLTLARDGKTNSKSIVYDNERIVPLRNYHQYDVNFDAQSVDLYNSGESTKTDYTHPGTVFNLQPKVSRVVSFVSAFNDISDQPIDRVTCVGDGCIEVNEMADSVYRVTVLEGLNFELYSDKGQCLLPYEFSSTSQLNFGQNYCLPIADNNQVQQIDVDNEILSAIFLGAFEESDQLSSSVEKLKLLGYQVVQKEIGNYKAVYIAHKTADMVDMLARDKKEIESIKLLAKGLYKADSISYPVANIN